MQAAGTCLVHYLFENVDFTRVRNSGTHVSFGASDGNPMAPMYISFDSSLAGFGEIVSPQMNGFGNIPGCSKASSIYGGGYACDSSVHIRRLVLWASNMGDIKISGPGYDVNPNLSGPTFGANGGKIHFDNSFGTMLYSPLIREAGYGAHVIVGEEYTIEDLSWIDDIYFVFSDPVMADAAGHPRQDEFVRLNLKMGNNTRQCTVSAAEPRLFISQDGVANGAARGNCTLEFYQLAKDAGFTTTEGATITTTIATTVEPHDCPCTDLASFDGRCGPNDPHGGLGCNACGIPTCRMCGHNIYPDCIEVRMYDEII